MLFRSRFALKFLEDQSYIQLKQALENKNYEDAFRSAHTLKGVCQNLSFDRLYEVSDKSLPNQIYSQNLIKVMQEKSISSNRTVARIRLSTMQVRAS